MFEGFVSPFAETERRMQYTNQAWDAVRSDPASAAVIAGLSMLAGNNGERSLGQLVGRAGLDTLEGMRSLDAQRRAQARFAERNRPAGSVVFEGVGRPEDLSGLSPARFSEAVSPSGAAVAAEAEADGHSLPQAGTDNGTRRRRLVRPRMSGRKG